MDFSIPVTKIQQALSGKLYGIKKYRWFIFLFAFSLYANTVFNAYSFDDGMVTYENKTIKKGLAAIPDILSSRYDISDERNGEFRPVTLISFALEYELFGLSPGISHFVNAILYGLVCVLLFTLWLKLFGDKYFEYILLGTLLFAVHPLHTEVVASLKNRENIFSLLFGLLSFIYILKYIDEGKAIYILAGLSFFLLAISSKIDIAVFAVLIPLALYYKGIRFRTLLIVCVLLVWTFYGFKFYQKWFLTASYARHYYYENPLYGHKSFPELISVMFSTLLYYLKLLLYPYPLRYYYGFNVVPLYSINNICLWFSAVIYLALFLIALVGIKKGSFLSFAVLWFLAAIFLFADIIEPVTGIIAERHTFIASAGFTITFAYLFVAAFDYSTKYISLMVLQPAKFLIFFLI